MAFPPPSSPCNVVPLFELPIERLTPGLGHQHGCRFIVLGHQYGRRDVMLKHSIENTKHPNFEWRGHGRGVDSFVL